MQFLYQFGPGDRPELATNPDAWTDEDNRVAAEHYERLVIFKAASEAAARHFMEDDPFVRNGLFTATLHPFRASLVRGEDS